MPLTETQMKYLSLAWLCCDSEPKIDYEIFHQVAGLKSVGSARESMRLTKNKLKEEYGDMVAEIRDKAGTTATPKKTAGDGAEAKTPASGRKKATPKKRVKADAGDDENAAEETPAKKAKVKAEPSVNGEDEDGDMPF